MKDVPPLDRAHELLERKNYDALLITSRENNRYLSNFTGSDSTLLIRAGDDAGYLYCDSRYTEQAKAECPKWRVIEYKNVVESVAKKIVDLKLKKVGFESRNISYNLYHRYLQAIDNAVLVPIETLVDKLRISKTEKELQLIEQAVKIAETAFDESIPLLKPGVKENEWALLMESKMRSLGSEPLPFDIIVASGQRGAMPHAKAAKAAIKKGDLVTIDFGACYKGYASDTTNTVAVGKPNKEMVEIYQVVLDAHDMAIEAAKPGVELKKIDAVARSYIDKKGFGKYFGHGLGHGVGLAVHEEPHLSPLVEGVLQEGAVVTVEPGIYIPGKGGVRIEDMIYVSADGPELLTTISKELKIIQ